MMTFIVVVGCLVFAWFLFGLMDQGEGIEKSIVSPKPIEWAASGTTHLGRWTVSVNKEQELVLIEAPSSKNEVRFGVYCMQGKPFVRWTGPGKPDPRGQVRVLKLGPVPMSFASSGAGSYYAQEPAKAAGLLFGQSPLQVQLDDGQTVAFDPTGYLDASQHLPISCRMVG